MSTSRLINRFYAFLILMITWFPGFSQNVGINPTGAAPNALAGLDVDFPDKGVLIPRVALTGTANFAPLSAHVAGMLVYNTATAGDVIPGFYYNDGTKWIPGLPAGNVTGDMLYWNGTAWVMIPAGTPGQFLQLSVSGLPVWGGSAFATLTTNAVTAIATTTATSGGTILSDGGSPVLSRGVCFATTANPTTGNSTVAGAATSPYTCNLSGLVAGTVYYVRAYSTNNSVISYGNQLTFSTLATVTTTAASLITSNSARTGGTVTTGNAPVTERGVCYATTSTPTTANFKVIDPSPGPGAFISDLAGLTENTLYYVRAYVINAGGTYYGSQITITTLCTLTTTAITAITTTTASSGGNVAVGGNASITARGVCWSTTTGPTIALTTKTNNGTGTGAFTSSITGLAQGTLYYVRAYATNAGGTAYGSELTFTTEFLTTAAVCTVTPTSAVSGGTIGTVTGLNITERGIVYSTNPGPTTADTKVTDPSGGTGTYVSDITGLTNGVTYYVRAYCINNGTTVYAYNELSFTTGTPHTVGESLAGGIVIYVDCSGQHGLIGGLSDLGSGIPWGCSGIAVGTTIAQGGGAIYAGLNNTNLMIAAGCQAPNGPAQLCAAYTAGGTGLPGITNWYLPSHDELQVMCTQRTLINLTTTPSYAGAGVLYWSSTEYSTSIAYTHYSLSLYDYNCYKYLGYYSVTSNLIYIRPIRAF